MKHFRKFWLIVGLVVTVFACKDDDDDNNNNPAPTISSVSPTSAAVGADVTITGTNFSTTPASNVVKFNNTAATVKSSTATQIVATVPTGATTGKITVTVNGQTATSSSDFTVGATVKEVVEVTGNLSSTTWTADKVYLLKSFVYVTSGNTLTIEPGTIIKGDTTTKGTLVISQGAKIEAVGTAEKPIIFTSARAKGARNRGDWGGVVLVGKAPINRPLNTPMEGGISGAFGGTDAADNSGTLKYVRIEFGGVGLLTTENSEVNGLTLYGVGSGTTIDYVQVSYSGDDSYEWFGGTVNAKHIVAFRGYDDDFDTDFGFTGKVQYAVSLRDPEYADQSKSNGFESDNFGGSGTPATGPNAGLPLTEPTFANVSIFVTDGTPPSTQQAGSGVYQSAMHLRRNTATSVFNSVFVGYPEGLRLEGAATYGNVTADKLQLKGIVLSNVTTPLVSARGNGETSPTDAEVNTFFNMAGSGNSVADIATLGLNSNTFNLTAPNFLPSASSSLLTGAVWTGKGADPFFTQEPFKGAFGTTDWTAGWGNFDPQNTDY